MASKQLESLKKSRDFSVLKATGRKRVITSWLMLSYKKTDLEVLRFGITIPKKVGSAVVRNKLKRWCREFIKSLSQENLKISYDVNFVFRPVSNVSFKEISFEEFKKAASPIFQSIFNNG